MTARKQAHAVDFNELGDHSPLKLAKFQGLFRQAHRW
jgi:hypothetical protein